MIVGIPKEIMKNENRVAALPETVEKFKKLGFDVMVETSAGEGAYASDDAYAQSGATIAEDAAKVFKKSDIILKVKEPLFNEKYNIHEIDMLREGQTLVTFLHPAAPSNHGDVKKIMEKKVTSFTMDGIPRISRAQRMDPLTSMSAITGYKAIIMAAAHFPKFIPMIGTSIGMIKPAKIMGCGHRCCGAAGNCHRQAAWWRRQSRGYSP